MSCCCKKAQIALAIENLTKEVRQFKNLMFPLQSPRWPYAIGKTRTISELEIGMTTFMTYEQDLGDLPPATGRNNDITKAVFVVLVDGMESMRVDAAFDLVTRKSTGPVAWRAPKGGSVVLQLGYLDDDGNSSEQTSYQFGIAADTIAPDAPINTAIGGTRVLGEIEV